MSSVKAIDVLRELAKRTDRERKPNLATAARGALRRGLGVALLGATLVTGSQMARAQTLTTLYSFAGGADGNGGNSLVMDAQGNLYGTSETGGAPGCLDGYGCGLVFKVTAQGVKTDIYGFTGGADGGDPLAALTIDAQGNLYGTTTWTATGGGAIFKVTAGGQASVLYEFSGGSDGGFPVAPLVMDKQGNLYGTTYLGGSPNYCQAAQATGCGVVFKVTPAGQESVLYTFPSSRSHGAYSEASVLVDAKGRLYGTTTEGGRAHCLLRLGCGVVFRLSTTGSEKLLYKFSGSDGAHPRGALITDQQGNFYGTTIGWPDDGNQGNVFELTPNGVETVLYTFTGLNGNGDGYWPGAGLVMDPQGNLYGTTVAGGVTGCNNSGCGTIFKVTPSGTETVLYRFCSAQNCADGSAPRGLVMDALGNLYGTTIGGGANGHGTVFKLTP